MNNFGPATRLAQAFINSKLTPLLIVALILLGGFAISLTPREEEPQIVVPMIDIMVMLPGADPAEIESRLARPLEQKIWETEGVEYVYTSSYPNFALITARFLVGHDMEKAMVRVYNKLAGNLDQMPPGTLPPLVKVRSIDDVPILSLTLWSDRYDHYELRQVAAELKNELQDVENVSVVDIVGGRRRNVRVELDPQRMAAFNVTPLSVVPALQSGNQSLPAGSFATLDRQFTVEAGSFLTSADDVAGLVVGVYRERPVRLGDVATVTDGPADIDSYAFHGFGPGAGAAGSHGAGESALSGGAGDRAGTEYPAVTVSIAKRKGSDATRVAAHVHEKLKQLQGRLIPADMRVTVTRDYGETAQHKATELIHSLMIAILLAVIVVLPAMGWRGALIIFLTIPTTFSLTLFLYYIMHYTLNRVTLFALILVTGLVVDDAIIIVENIHRHFKMAGRRSLLAALQAIEEVGNPTILATFTVIASVLPMAFVRGLMGPYMRPMPIGASLAMLFSLFIALVIAPWLAMRLLGEKQSDALDATGGFADDPEFAAQETGYHLHDTKIFRIYSRIMAPLIASGRRRALVFGAVTGLTVLVSLLFVTRTVQVKMLPFDNKSEFQVIVDTPEGTTLEHTTQIAREIGAYLATVPEVTDYQIYAGAPAPVNFNGLVRHYFLRQGPNVADLQVNLLPKKLRQAQSHDIAKRVRGPIQEIAQRHGAAVKIAEVPPGPPVLSTLVAEVYGPDPDSRMEVARQVREVFASTPGVVDIDWYVEADQTRYRFVVDKERAAVRGVGTDQVARTLAVALGGFDAGLAHVPDAAEPVPINLRLPQADRAGLEALSDLYVQSQSGSLIPLSDVARVETSTLPKSLHRRNLKPVVYVTADVAGELESPIYAILDMKAKIAQIPLPGGARLKQHFKAQPVDTETPSLKWDGEWHITYEVFRDLGLAFAIVLVLIYLLIVGWFQNFVVPLLMMIPIPLTLVGIIPGHLIFGAFFTATSMIGFIALAGIMVRNSVLLIDFIEARLKQGLKLEEAVIESGAVRFLPIALTAGAVITASSVMVFDPIFQGLALSLVFGALISTLMTVVVIPLAYYSYARWRGVGAAAIVEDKTETVGR
jgi:multidrug efflux pump subunit AcrB